MLHNIIYTDDKTGLNISPFVKKNLRTYRYLSHTEADQQPEIFCNVFNFVIFIVIKLFCGSYLPLKTILLTFNMMLTKSFNPIVDKTFLMFNCEYRPYKSI